MTYSQSTETIPTNEELVIMTKEKHEALRRDLHDYKLLLAKYQTIRIEQEILIADLERQGKLLENKSEILDDFRKKNEQLLNEIDALNVRIEKQKLELGDLREDYNNLSRAYYTEKAKVYRMQKDQAGVWVWRGLAIFFFFSMLVVGSQN